MTNKWNENEENFENQGQLDHSQDFDFQEDNLAAEQTAAGAEEDWTFQDEHGNPILPEEDVEIEEIIEYVDEVETKPSLLNKFGFRKKKNEPTDGVEIPGADFTEAAAAPTMASPKKRKGPKAPKPGKVKSVAAAASDILVEGHVINFGGKPTAANIFWDTYETGVSVKERTKQLDIQTNADSDEQYYSLYIDHSRAGMMGFSRKLQGHKAGIPALLSMIMPEKAGQDWIGVFLLEERSDTWLLASVHKGIYFDDRIIRGRMNAEEAFNEGSQAPGLTKFFAPEAWGHTYTDPTPLHELLDFNIGLKLKHVHPIQANLAKIVLGSMLGIMVVGGLTYWKMDQDRKMRELEELERRIRENVAVTPESLPWHKLTRIEDFLASCYEEINKSIVIAPGWSTQPISCVTSKGTATLAGGWNYIDGNFAWLRASVPVDFPQPTLTPTGKTASFSRSAPAPFDDLSHKDVPWQESKIDRWLIERFQNHGVDISIRPSNDNRSEASMRPQFNSTDIRLTIRDNPQIYGDLLKDVPALVPVSLIYNVESNVWDLILKAHHPVIMPKPR